MALNPPSPGANSAVEYSVSAVPWLTSSAGTGAFSFSFPFVTRFIVVKNTSAIGGSSVNVGFTLNGVMNSGNCISLAPSESFEGELRCTQLWTYSASSYSVAVVAGLTMIPEQFFPLLTGSNGFKGVG